MDAPKMDSTDSVQKLAENCRLENETLLTAKYSEVQGKGLGKVWTYVKNGIIAKYERLSSHGFSSMSENERQLTKLQNSINNLSKAIPTASLDNAEKRQSVKQAVIRASQAIDKLKRSGASEKKLLALQDAVINAAQSYLAKERNVNAIEQPDINEKNASIIAFAKFQYLKSTAPNDQWPAKIEHLKIAAQGYLPAKRLLAQEYRSGEHVPQDIDNAIKLYQEAAEQGDPKSQQEVNQYNHLKNLGTYKFQNGKAIFGKWQQAWASGKRLGEIEKELDAFVNTHFHDALKMEKGDGRNWRIRTQLMRNPEKTKEFIGLAKLYRRWCIAAQKDHVESHLQSVTGKPLHTDEEINRYKELIDILGTKPQGE